MPLRVFISSVQSEFAEERRNLRDFIRSDATLSRYFDVFLFEDQPAQTRSPTDLYLDEVERCNVYVGLFGVRYGYEDAEGGGRSAGIVIPKYLRLVRAAHARCLVPARHVCDIVVSCEAESQDADAPPDADSIDRLIAPVWTQLQKLGVAAQETAQSPS